MRTNRRNQGRGRAGISGSVRRKTGTNAGVEERFRSEGLAGDRRFAEWIKAAAEAEPLPVKKAAAILQRIIGIISSGR